MFHCHAISLAATGREYGPAPENQMDLIDTAHTPNAACQRPLAGNIRGRASAAPPRPALARLAGLMRSARSVVALTGAGISVPSGIPDFRSPGTGLWEKVDPIEVAHIDAFHADPVRFWGF